MTLEKRKKIQDDENLSQEQKNYLMLKARQTLILDNRNQRRENRNSKRSRILSFDNSSMNQTISNMEST